MAERRPSVERRLEQLALEVEAQAPDLAPAVRGRLDRASAPPRHGQRRIAAFVVGLLLLAASTAYAASADVREAVRELLGIGAIEIERVPELGASEAPVELGRPIDPSQASDGAGFDLAENPALGMPTAAFMADVAGQRALSFVYPSGLILTQIEGRDPAIVKQVLLSANVEPVRVDGERGYWVGGADHLVEFPEGTAPRTSANALIWTRGPLTLRLEAEIPKGRALRIARGLR